MSSRRLVRIIRDLEKQGAEVIQTRKGWTLRFPDGTSTTTHRTPSDHRAHKNLRADVERAGFVWPRKA